MKEKIKTLIVGMIIGALLVPTVFATVGTVTKELSYNDIKITLNGKEVKPTDSDGNYVEPFIIDGTTYLPVRGVANALDLGVEWDGVTNTVKLSNEESESESATGGKLKVGEVILNENGVKVTLSEIEAGKNIDTYYFLVENTTDAIATFSAGDMSTNGFMIASGMSTGNIQPHKKEEVFVIVWKGENSQHKKDVIEELEFTARYSVRTEDNKKIAEGEKLITLKF